MRQTVRRQLEVIVIDSGSQQNEARIVKRFIERYPQIRYYRTRRRETQYRAWNRALALARGRYITTANTDEEAQALLAGFQVPFAK